MENWQSEMNRLFDMFERESTISLRKISQSFYALNRPFDEQFFQYFMKMSNFSSRLESSFNTVLLERQHEAQMMPSTSVPTHGSAVENQLSTGSMASHHDVPLENENPAQLMIEEETDVVSSDEDDVLGWQPISATNCSINDLIESSAPLESNEAEVEHIAPAVCNDSENNDEVYVKLECKVEEEQEADELPMVEFNPNEYGRNDIQNNAVNDEPFHNPGQSRSRSVVQKQSKRSQSKRFQCKNCKFTARYKSHLRMHLLIHTGVKPFKCDYCGYACRHKGTLLSHIKMHVRQKEMDVAPDPNNGLYKCKLCAQSFMNAKDLCAHMTKLHKSNQRLFNCAKCSRRFSHKIQKVQHETKCRCRGYECYLCKYVTAKFPVMQQHMRMHTGAKPFGCNLCVKNFRFEISLKLHLNSIHSGVNA